MSNTTEDMVGLVPVVVSAKVVTDISKQSKYRKKKQRSKERRGRI